MQHMWDPPPPIPCLLKSEGSVKLAARCGNNPEMHKDKFLLHALVSHPSVGMPVE